MIINGALSESSQYGLATGDRGFLLGDGLFETIKVVNGQPRFLAQHWQRLSQSSQLLAFTLPFSFSELKVAVEQLIHTEELQRAGLRLTLSVGCASRGLWPEDRSRQPFWILESFSLPSCVVKPTRLMLSSIYSEPSNPVNQLKSLSCLHRILVKKEAVEKGVDDALQQTAEGFLTETSCANFFIIKDEQLFTSKLEYGVLPGIMRAQIIKYCHKDKIVCHEATLTIAQLNNADAAFISNVLIGISKVTSMNDKVFYHHHLLEKLQSVFND